MVDEDWDYYIIWVRPIPAARCHDDLPAFWVKTAQHIGPWRVSHAGEEQLCRWNIGDHPSAQLQPSKDRWVSRRDSIGWLTQSRVGHQHSHFLSVWVGPVVGPQGLQFEDWGLHESDRYCAIRSLAYSSHLDIKCIHHTCVYGLIWI